MFAATLWRPGELAAFEVEPEPLAGRNPTSDGPLQSITRGYKVCRWARGLFTRAPGKRWDLATSGDEMLTRIAGDHRPAHSRNLRPSLQGRASIPLEPESASEGAPQINADVRRSSVSTAAAADRGRRNTHARRRNEVEFLPAAAAVHCSFVRCELCVLWWPRRSGALAQRCPGQALQVPRKVTSITRCLSSVVRAA